MFRNVDTIRQGVASGLAGLLAVNCLLVLARMLMRQEGIDPLVVAAMLVIAVPAIGLALRSPLLPLTRMVTSLGLAAQASFLVYVFSGSPIQADMHMYFFALLAITAAWLDRRAILAYSALVALHHLALFFLSPQAVFPGEAAFGRVIIHASILLLQTGVMVAVAEMLPRVMADKDEARRNSWAAEEANEVLQQLRTVDEERQRAAEEVARLHGLEVERTRDVVHVLNEALRQLSAGNLQCQIVDSFAGELDQVRQTFNMTVLRLTEALYGIAEVASQIQMGSGEIDQAARGQASRADQQAQTIEATAAALEKLSGTVNGTAVRSQEIGALVSKTRMGAERSGEVVERAITAMRGIERSSADIANIIGVIDEIAFQTNLLALNAGVEAARAGQAGKGFAVVAQEVRELAQRSAKAAKEIKHLIQGSADQVKTGVALVDATGEALRTIEREVQVINEHVDAVAQGTVEQSDALRNIALAVSHIDRNTQDNAAMADRQSGACELLARQTDLLADLIGRFHTQKVQATRVARAS